MVDPGRVRALLDRLAEELGHLRRLASYSDEKLFEDADRFQGVKYRFVVAIEICIDVAQHVISSEGLRAPADFADAFVVLGESEVLDEDLVRHLGDMARFRNLLVHGYGRVDDARVSEILRTRLEDFDQFRSAIARIALSGNSTDSKT